MANPCKERKTSSTTWNGLLPCLFAANTLGMVLAESINATGFLVSTKNIFAAELKWNEKKPQTESMTVGKNEGQTKMLWRTNTNQC